MLYFEKQLVLCDSLHWFDQVRGDGVSEAMSLLDFLQVKNRGKKDILGKELLSLLAILLCYGISHCEARLPR